MDNEILDEKALSEKYLLNTYSRDYTHFTHGQGARLFTKGGAEYIDFTAGIGVNSLGHNHPQLVESIAEQAKKLLHLSNLFYIDSQAKLAQKMVALAGQEMRVFFCNSGLEANECAIKIARIYGERTRLNSDSAESGDDSADSCAKNSADSATCGDSKGDLFTAYKNHRYKIITLQNSFHGRSIATLRACGQDKMHTHFSPFPEGFIYAKDIDDAIAIATQDRAVVAIFLELIQGEGGIYAMPKDAVQRLERFCRQNDVLLMLDEVQSGVFRSGEFLSAQVYGIKPNVVTLAKGLAGGVPIGAVMCDKLDIFAPSQHGSTFGGNPLSTTAGIAALSALESHKNSGKLRENIEIFEAQLESIKSEFGAVVSGVSGIGLMRGLKIKNDEILGAIINKARENRLLVLKSGNATLRFLPPILITESEILEGFSRLRTALNEVVRDL